MNVFGDWLKSKGHIYMRWALLYVIISLLTEFEAETWTDLDNGLSFCTRLEFSYGMLLAILNLCRRANMLLLVISLFDMRVCNSSSLWVQNEADRWETFLLLPCCHSNRQVSWQPIPGDPLVYRVDSHHCPYFVHSGPYRRHLISVLRVSQESWCNQMTHMLSCLDRHNIGLCSDVGSVWHSDHLSHALCISVVTLAFSMLHSASTRAQADTQKCSPDRLVESWMYKS